MKRIPESHELMDEYVEAEAYADSDFSEPHNAFVALFQKLFPDFSEGVVLDIGCGNADPTIRFAKAYPKVQLIGLDGSEAMLSFGREAASKAGLSDRIKLEKDMLQEYMPPPELFDAIICNSLLHHLQPPGALWTAIKKLAKRAAPVLVMDFFRPPTLERAKELVALHAIDSPELMTGGFYNSLLAAYRPEEVRMQLNAAGLSTFHVEVTSDRHMIIFGKT